MPDESLTIKWWERAGEYLCIEYMILGRIDQLWLFLLYVNDCQPMSIAYIELIERFPLQSLRC